MASLDEGIVQRYLYAISDVIADDIANFQKDDLKNILQLTTDTAASRKPPSNNKINYLEDEEEVKCLSNQAKILTEGFLTDPELAHVMYGDRNKDSIDKYGPLDTRYMISSNFVIFYDGIPYIFNIDTANRTNDKVFFSSVVIKNESKSILTLKSNYKISLKVNFTYFEDLLEESITAVNIYNTYSIKIAPIYILYQYYNQNTSQFGKGLSDGNGIYLNQKLIFKDDTIQGASLREKLKTTTINKNYHLTYFKHHFDVFKTEEPVGNYYDNELLIEYVAYETDGVANSLNTSISGNTNNFVPLTNGNLYKLINKNNISLSSVGVYGNELETLEKAQDYIKQAQIDLANLSEPCVLPNSKTAQISAANQQRINNINTNLQKLRKNADKVLKATIIEKCRIFSIEIPNSYWPYYQVGNFWETFTQSFSLGELLQFTLSGAGVGATFGALPGAAIGAGVGAGIYLGAHVIRSIMSKKILTRNIAIPTIRKQQYTVKDYGFKQLANQKTISYNKQSQWTETNNKDADIFMRMLENLNILDAPEQVDMGSQELYFTTLGQLLNILYSFPDIAPNLSTIVGGYFIDASLTGNGMPSYNNLCNLPISLSYLGKFLTATTFDTGKVLHYDTDTYFNNIFQNLIKKVTREGEMLIPSTTLSSPKHLRAAIEVSSGDINPADYLGHRKSDLLEDNDINNLILDMFTRRNKIFDNSQNQNKKIRKIYKIISIEEMQFYDFYNEFTKEMDKIGQAHKKFLYNSIEFQEFINKKHYMPCIMLHRIADTESLLKTKNVKFSRIDNANLDTGNWLNDGDNRRFPYQASMDLKAMMSFFIDLGSYVFVCPPMAKSTSMSVKNLFGFGGLYMIDQATFEYNFQRLENGNITIPNFDSRLSVRGYMISHGDRVIPKPKPVQEKAPVPCPPPPIQPWEIQYLFISPPS